MCSLDRKYQNNRVFTDCQASYYLNFYNIGTYKSFLITTVIKYNLFGSFGTKGSVDLIYHCSVFLVQSLVLGNFSTGKIQYGGQLLLFTAASLEIFTWDKVIPALFCLGNPSSQRKSAWVLGIPM